MTIEKRLERLEAILDARGLDWDHPRVAEEPAKEPEPEHPAGPMPDPGEGYRILSKDPPEELMPGDELQYINGTWVASDNARTHRRQGLSLWYRRKIEPANEPEHPAGPMPDPGEGYRILSKDPPEDLAEGDDFWFSSYSEWHKSFHATLGITSQCDRLWFRRKIEPPKPAWGPKVGDWVKVTRPGDWTEWEHPNWEGAMNQFDEKIGKIECEWGDCFQICGFAAPNGFRYQFHRDWLSPAEPPEPPQPEYREPVLPADCGKVCEFSDDDKTWRSGYLKGFDYDEHRHQGAGWRRNQTCSADRARHRFARIKKDA